MSVGIRSLVLGNLFRGNHRVRNSHPVSLFYFVDENTKAQRDRKIAHFKSSSQMRAGRESGEMMRGVVGWEGGSVSSL